MNRFTTTSVLVSILFLLSISLISTDSGFAMNKSGDTEKQRPSTQRTMSGLPFAWPFRELSSFNPRGGRTQGTEVSLAESPSDRWQALQEHGLSKKERDRRAILSMAGSYRVSFQFSEIVGFTDEYEPARPYFSWTTEHIDVLSNNPSYISLQHTLVIYFKNKDGTIKGPKVMKHWRQDWQYEDRERLVYEGNRTWRRKRLSPRDVDGTWTKTVYQVDDAPRYEALGRWTHGNGYSTWSSRSFRRPLPRRERSVRNDYELLQGTHTITITRDGWVHEQSNSKIAFTGSNAERQIAREIGINRYQRITKPDLAEPASTYWNRSGWYWSLVRDTWNSVLETRDRFKLVHKVNGQPRFGPLLKAPGTMEANNKTQTRTFVRTIIDSAIQKPQ